MERAMFRGGAIVSRGKQNCGEQTTKWKDKRLNRKTLEGTNILHLFQKKRKCSNGRGLRRSSFIQIRLVVA